MKKKKDMKVQLAVGSIYLAKLSSRWCRFKERARTVPKNAVGSLAETMRGLL